ncbi:hypothetical protein DEO48_26015 [Enterobacter sp. CGMCC 5087]|uniref:fimbrial protein n=1 Tax=Enterobacter sp. CGMCC 5087 TaxID=2183878 RepID=UPI000D6797F5|nr:hypothetical protein [Enterobacter sp. CGMCC 5087]PWI77121.1 hypothetical protein DEO48_26015 [Enterobacter sp. CGMCC 5087]
MIAVKSSLLAGILVCATPAMADSGPTIYGTSFPLTLTLNVERSTCILSLASPDLMTFTTAANQKDFRVQGPILRLGTKDITLHLSNCAGSKQPGVIPAIQVTGQTLSGYDDLFQFQNTQITGALGFGLRHKDNNGVLGGYIRGGDSVELAPRGGEPADGDVNFIVDMRYLGGEIKGSGAVVANFNFKMAYR